MNNFKPCNMKTDDRIQMACLVLTLTTLTVCVASLALLRQRLGSILTVDSPNPQAYVISSEPLDLAEEQSILSNRFVDSIRTRGKPPTSSNDDFIFEWQDYRFQEVSAFYAITNMGKWIQPYLAELGVSPVAPIKVTFFEGALGNNYGCSSHQIELANHAPVDSSIVAHEYGHAIHAHVIGCEKFSGLDGTVSSTLLEEAYGDFFSIAFSNHPFIGKYRYHEFGHLFDQNPFIAPDHLISLKDYLRFFQAPHLKVWEAYPQEREPVLNGLKKIVTKKGYLLEPHFSSRVLTSALLELSKKISVETTLRLVLKGMKNDSLQVSFVDSYRAILTSDRELADGRHAQAIRNAFEQGGLLREVVVTMYDNDFDFRHEALIKNLWVNEKELPDGIDNDENGYVDDIHAYDIESKTGDTTKVGDDCGHGTMVANVISKADQEIKVLGVRFGMNTINRLFSQSQAESAVAEISAAWELGLKPQSRIFHFSGGMSRIDCLDYAQSLYPDYSLDQLNDVCDHTVSAWKDSFRALIKSHPNELFVFAAGNHGISNDQEPVYPCSLRYENTLCVANVRKNGDGKVEIHQSNFGKNSVDVAAYGFNKKAACGGTESGYGKFAKSSGAAAEVSNLAASLWIDNPYLSARDVRELIIGTAEQKPSLLGLISTGGIIHKERATLSARLSVPFGNNVTVSNSAAYEVLP